MPYLAHGFRILGSSADILLVFPELFHIASSPSMDLVLSLSWYPLVLEAFAFFVTGRVCKLIHISILC